MSIVGNWFISRYDKHAPCWTKMSIEVLKGNCLSHAYGLNQAMEIAKEKYGECIWPNIPEECFEQAISEMKQINEKRKKYII